jgi:hypothetical protein
MVSAHSHDQHPPRSSFNRKKRKLRRFITWKLPKRLLGEFLLPPAEDVLLLTDDSALRPELVFLPAVRHPKLNCLPKRILNGTQTFRDSIICCRRQQLRRNFGIAWEAKY